MHTFIDNNKTISDLNEKVLDLMNDRCMIPPNLACSLVSLFKPGNTSKCKLI